MASESRAKSSAVFASASATMLTEVIAGQIAWRRWNEQRDVKLKAYLSKRHEETFCRAELWTGATGMDKPLLQQLSFAEPV